MFPLPEEAPELSAPVILNAIEAAACALLKPHGFRKHGRTLHRFVSGDISQVVNFQLGQSYLGATHLLSVNIGIRVPECMLRSYQPEEPLKKYYHEYECNLRSRLGSAEGKEESVYDLRTPTAEITADILRQLETVVLPVFDTLSSRQAILEKRRDYPQFDRLSHHLILLEEAMIYGRMGNFSAAEARFRQYYRSVVHRMQTEPGAGHLLGHLRVLEELALRLEIPLNPPQLP